jgi:hypothetical protein
MKQEETEIIDLTLDDEEDEPRSSFTAAPVLTPKAEEYPEDPGDETKMTICELLECLSADELKKFAKQMKLKLNGTV